MTKVRSSLPVLLSPLGAAFRCSACGDCCRGWSVDVDQASFHAITLALDRKPHPLALRGVDVFDPSPTPTRGAYAKLRKGQDGACVFLEKDNLCYLHRHFGPEVKPAVCRTYPFRPVQRPDGVHAPATLSCSAMRKELFRAPEAEIANPAALVIDEGHHAALAQLPFERHSPGAYVLLGKGRKIRVELLSKIEDRLAHLLCDRSLPLSHRLLGARYFVEALADGAPGNGPQVSPKEIDACYQHTIGGPELTPLRERCAAAQPIVRHHLGLMFELLAEIEKIQGQGQPLCTRQALYFGLGMEVSNEERDQLAVCLYGWRYTEHEPEFLPILESYLIERLRAGSLTTRMGLVATVQTLVVGAALVRFLTTGIAGQAEQVATRQHLLQAIEEVERRFFHRPLILERFTETAPPLCREVRYAELLLLLPPAPPQEYPEAAPDPSVHAGQSFYRADAPIDTPRLVE